MNVLSTNQLAEKLNVSPHLIRTWQHRFASTCPEPTERNPRFTVWSSKSVAEWKRFIKQRGLRGSK